MVCDLHSTYGIDLHDPAVRARPGSWLRARIAGLLSVETRLSRQLTPEPESR